VSLAGMPRGAGRPRHGDQQHQEIQGGDPSEAFHDAILAIVVDARSGS
jgi:hypothetical protein